MIAIMQTIEKLSALGFDVSHHTTKHPLCIQRERIASHCKQVGVEPVEYKAVKHHTTPRDPWRPDRKN